MTGSRKEKGVTLVELLVAVVVSTLVIAGIYRAFLGQEKKYRVQEEIAEMQQNIRVALGQMVREIRMAGFGNVSMVLPVSFRKKIGNTVVETTYANIINPDQPFKGWLTVVLAVNSPSNCALLTAHSAGNVICVNRLNDDQGDPIFDLENKRYLSVDGVESNEILNIAAQGKDKILVLKKPLIYKHMPGTRVYPVRAISYELGREDNAGGGKQPIASYLEEVRFQYLDNEGNEILNPSTEVGKIKMVRVLMRAKTASKDFDFKSSDGYHRRELFSNIRIRNLR